MPCNTGKEEGCVMGVDRQTTHRRWPSMTAIMVSTSTWPVKALVDATPISGPTCKYTPASVARAMLEPTCGAQQRRPRQQQH
jgi:hypothetical protein